VNFDAASGLALHPAGRAALLAALEDGWADPGRLYASARRARQLLDGARSSVAGSLGCRPDEVFFAPNGTAARYAGVRGLAAGRARVGRVAVHSAVEHSATLHACRELDAVPVPVSRTGAVDPAAFAAALGPDTALACLIAASHEVGTRQPVPAVADACSAAEVPLLVDAAASVGWEPVPEGWSALVADAPLWGGPPGVGVLAVRTGVRFVPAYPEDEHEGGRFPGPVALPQVLAAAVALEAVVAEREAVDARLRPLVDTLRGTLAAIPDVEVVGDGAKRLPHVVTFSCLYVEGEQLVQSLDAAGFEVSSGSSCTSSSLEPSHVLVAMGALTHGNVRVSLTPSATTEDVTRFCEVLLREVTRLRGEAGL
jgi:cysteine desulfurase